MKKVSEYLHEVRVQYGDSIAKKVYRLMADWDGRNDVTQSFYDKHLLDMKLREALEIQ